MSEEPPRPTPFRKRSGLIWAVAAGFTLSAGLVAVAARTVPYAIAPAHAVAAASVPPAAGSANAARSSRAHDKSMRVLSPLQPVAHRLSIPQPATLQTGRAEPKPVTMAMTMPGLSHRLFGPAGQPTSFMPSAGYRMAQTDSRRIALDLAQEPAFAIASAAVPATIVSPPGATDNGPQVEVALLEPSRLPSSVIAHPAPELEAASVPTPRARPRHRIRDADRPVAATRPARREPKVPVLAYARPDAGDDDVPPPFRGRTFATPGKGVAVYDISAAMVYLPNGEKLEAHSGLGMMRDDPSYAHKKMRGPTPPHTYTLSMRESLFHGVAAIRLNPVGGQKAIHNRNGLLAHTYMLGKGGDSNGCVSIKDYKRFLAAFRRGEIKKLVVVAKMSRNPVGRFASIFR
ncbi:hypothetical protein Sa4125_17260 [Aureimonas sp. SA4125]|nr:hypothetical protein Sa4125_17260 [Aureimonas sp. SA4125]